MLWGDVAGLRFNHVNARFVPLQNTSPAAFGVSAHGRCDSSSIYGPTSRMSFLMELILPRVDIVFQKHVRLIVHLTEWPCQRVGGGATHLHRGLTLASMFSHSRHITSPRPPNAREDRAVMRRPCAYAH